jgi:hypothetical protein
MPSGCIHEGHGRLLGGNISGGDETTTTDVEAEANKNPQIVEKRAHSIALVSAWKSQGTEPISCEAENETIAD